MKHGFVRVAAAVPRIRVADCGFNTQNIIKMLEQADGSGVQIVAFPELSVTAYTCGDLFHQHTLVKGAEEHLEMIAEATIKTDVTAIIGMPLRAENQLFNCAVVVSRGKILGAVPKSYIPNYKEFYEERWFASGLGIKGSSAVICGQSVPFGTDLLFEAEGQPDICFGIEICEDLWVPVPPSCWQSLSGATLLFNLSASNDLIGKYEYRKELIKQQSGKCIAGYVYTSSGIDESTTDVVFGGHSIIAENGGIKAESKRFLRDEQLVVSDIDVQWLSNDRLKNTSFMAGTPAAAFRKVPFQLKQTDDAESLARYIDAHPFVPSNPKARDRRCEEIFDIQTSGLAKRLSHTGMKTAVIGISGGLDSTLALLVTAKTFDLLGISRSNILAVTMPGFGTTDITYTNALQLMKSMEVTIKEINIKDSCLQHFKDIGHDPAIHDVTYENVQARERTQILMDLANKMGGLVIGTGDLSELALGWCTYNGDHMSMYAVNCSIPKTLVKYLVQWVADNIVDESTREVLLKVLDTPISPELLPPDPNGEICQKTEDIVGPYELHDFFLYHMVRYGASPSKILFLAKQAFAGVYDDCTIIKWLKSFYRRFFSQQFKRSCLPDGPKVGTISLSPRGDWRMPSDASAKLWLDELEGCCN